MHEYAHYLTYLLAEDEMQRRLDEADRVRSARVRRRRKRSRPREATLRTLRTLRVRTEGEGR